MTNSSIIVTNSDGSSSNNNNQLIQFNPASQLPIKLTGSTNFSTWKAQIEMLLHGHDLYGFLDGTNPAPPTTISEKETQIPNPAFKLWFRQDKLIQNALLASVDSTLASTVATAASAKSAYDSLHTAFANKSQTRIFSLRDQLARLTKENRTIAVCLHEIRSIADELATAGSPVTNAKIELYEKLLDHELFLKHAELAQGPAPITAAVAQSHYSNNLRSSRRSQPPSQWRPSSPQSAAPSTGWRPASTTNYNGSRVRCQLCDRYGHSTKVCRSRSHNHFEAKANFASTSNQPNLPWIVDSGVSHHITADTQHLAYPHDNNGASSISMGDGNIIPITHSGTACLSTPNHTFHLKNTLCAPAIKQNLLSVSKFCSENSTSIEFSPNSFCVKDLQSGVTLMRGQSKDGLYQWPQSSMHSPPGPQ
nr:PREDICTED: uncharacterized protein LOC108201278 [Daucus carota subsp. sativus]